MTWNYIFFSSNRSKRNSSTEILAEEILVDEISSSELKI